jgi:hypothetical protein
MKNAITHCTTNKDKKEAIKTALCVCLLLAVIVAGAVGLSLEKPHTTPDKTYPMTNARIVWCGAGYNGVYSHE